MNTIVAYRPILFAKSEHGRAAIASLAAFLNRRTAQTAMTRAASAQKTMRNMPAEAVPARATLQAIWGHTVKRAKQGSALHRQTLALLDRDARLAILAACSPWLD